MKRWIGLLMIAVPVVFLYVYLMDRMFEGHPVLFLLSLAAPAYVSLAIHLIWDDEEAGK